MAEVTVNDIKNKVLSLIDEVNHTRQQRDVLLQSNAHLTENNDRLKIENEQLLNTIQNLEVRLNQVQEMPVSDKEADSDRKEIKNKIRELAAEIDKCIALLNHEK